MKSYDNGIGDIDNTRSSNHDNALMKLNSMTNGSIKTWLFLNNLDDSLAVWSRRLNLVNTKATFESFGLFWTMSHTNSQSGRHTHSLTHNHTIMTTIQTLLWNWIINALEVSFQLFDWFQRIQIFPQGKKTQNFSHKYIIYFLQPSIL